MPYQLADEDYENVRATINENINPGPINFAETPPYLTTSIHEGPAVTFQPLVVTRFGGTVPWGANVDQTLCGDSIVNNDGSQSARITMAGFMFLQDMRDLFDLASETDTPHVVWEGSDATDITRVTFDQIKFDRKDEEDIGAVNNHLPAPLYSFQLQSKQDDQPA